MLALQQNEKNKIKYVSGHLTIQADGNEQNRLSGEYKSTFCMTFKNVEAIVVRNWIGLRRIEGKKKM